MKVHLRCLCRVDYGAWLKSAQEWEEHYNELWNQFDQYIYTIENEEDD